MKKKHTASVILMASAVIFICLLIVFLLIRKNAGSEDAAVSASAADGYDASDDILKKASLSSLFEEYSENLLIYNGDAVSDMSYPEFVLCDCGILLYDTDYSESEINYVNFYIFDPETGEITASARYNCEFITDIKQTDAGLMYCDSSIGYAALLDEDLSVRQKWYFEPNYEYWYLAEDGSGIYIIDDCALTLYDLESGTSEIILESSVSLYGGTPLNGGANISYIDDGQMSVDVWLDFGSGTLSVPSFDEAVYQVTINDDIWLASVEGVSKDYIFGTEDNALFVSLEEGTLCQIQGSEYILCTDDENTLTLYDTDGSFISSCTLAGDDIWFYSNYCSYSEIYGGFFILAYSDNGPELFFWDADSADPDEGEDLSVISLEEYEQIPGGESADASLYERASSIAEEYGVEILIADQCETEYEDFIIEQVSDYTLISEGLDILEAALSVYPEGFFDQLKYDKITKVQINLAGTMTPVNDNWGGEGYNGLTQEYRNACVIVLDLNELYVDTVYHEISHVIDKKLEWDSYCRTDALFSEEGWNALNPENFEYEYVYSGFTELEFEGDEYLYFIDTYSMVSPTEDRARIMEYAMCGYSGCFEDFDQILAKLSYYSECIRDAFDTDGWPEEALWEEMLSVG